MKKTLIATAIAGAMAFSAHASADAYIAGGIYDFGDSNVYLAGGGSLTPELSLHGKFIDAGDSVLRVTGEYLMRDIDSSLSAVLGISHYDWGMFDDTGAIVGASYHLQNDDMVIPVIFRGTYDTAWDGFFGLEVGTRYFFEENLAVEGSYKINTNGMDNEIGVGLRFTF
ncbi:hypothetical protein [Marinimicrobium alkaliphilum]|uniref:hypothetical protein n=1 Tax=Marinimicrobium alkaliphilum TaxID=2202654 RepID=UPI000DB9DD29|nr:hypothetical protein [Marinimicrobium alkaliphilum]